MKLLIASILLASSTGMVLAQTPENPVLACHDQILINNCRTKMEPVLGATRLYGIDGQFQVGIEGMKGLCREIRPLVQAQGCNKFCYLDCKGNP